MALDMTKETVRLDRPIGKETAQILLEGDTIVPDSKADAQEVLRCRGRIELEEPVVSEERIGVKGSLHVEIMYRTKNSTQPLSVMESTLPIEDVMHMDGLQPSAEVTLTAKIEHLSCSVVNDRKINTRAVLALGAKAQESVEIQPLAAVAEDMVEVKMGQMTLKQTAAEKRDRFLVQEEVALPAEKPAIGEILSKDAVVADVDIRPMEGKLSMRGNLRLTVLYIPEGTEAVAESVVFRLPFHGTLDMEGLTAQSQVSAKCKVLEMRVEPLADEGGEDRILQADISVGVAARAKEEMHLPVVEDAYHPQYPLHVNRQQISYPMEVGICRGRLSVKENIVLSMAEAPVMQVKDISCRVDSVEAMVKDGMVELEGVLQMEALYLCQDDRTPFALLRREVPFSGQILCKEARNADTAEVSVTVEDCDLQMLSDAEGELRVTMAVEAALLRQMEAVFATELSMEEQPQEKMTAGAVIYVVQPGDSVWEIAKKYGVPVEQLLRFNAMEDSSAVYPGQKLLLLKTTKEQIG